MMRKWLQGQFVRRSSCWDPDEQLGCRIIDQCVGNPRMKSQLAEDRNGVRAVSFRHDNLISRWPRNLPGQRTMRYSFEVAAADGESPYCGVMEAECDDAEVGRSGRVEPSRSGSAITIASCSARVLEPMFIRTPFQTLVRTHGTAPADCDSQPYGALQTSQDRDWPSGKGGPPTGGRPRFATSADLARVAGRVAVAPGASVAVFRSLHTHFIELQPSHTLEQDPFLVLAKQRWNVSGACRPLDDAAHPTHSANLRSGSVSRSC
jgi:hypothetical protein